MLPGTGGECVRVCAHVCVCVCGCLCVSVCACQMCVTKSRVTREPTALARAGLEKKRERERDCV